MSTHDRYYVPHGSYWPIVGTIGLMALVVGIANVLNGGGDVSTIMVYAGLAILVVMMYGWFRDQIRESMQGLYSKQLDVSYRMGMSWFIFSEVMFFAAFFGALFYTRELSIPWLGGEGTGAWTNYLLWSDYSASWPSNGPAEVGGPFETVSAWGIPFINTLILLTSGYTITMAHWALKKQKRMALNLWLGATVLLGAVFLFYQAEEYIHAYQDLNLTMESGVYGSTFYMLTGFHGLHVTLGTIMLLVILFRCMAGHFSGDNHFAFEAVAWYWHFVDVVWLGLFIFVYVL